MVVEFGMLHFLTFTFDEMLSLRWVEINQL